MAGENVSDFPEEVAQTIRDGLKHGLTEEQMVQGIVSLGNLANYFVRPDTVEEAFVKQMWDAANEGERETLARIVLRIGKRKVH